MIRSRRRKQIWVFGSGNGKNYADNSRALFEYVSANEQSVYPVWLTGEKSIRDAIRSKGLIAYTFYSPKGIYCALMSKTLVLTNSFLDISLICYLLPRSKFIAQLWHGTPLKVLENMAWTWKKSLLIKTFLRYVGRDCDLVFSATPLNQDAFIKNFKVTKDRIKVTGQPRNDWLLSRPKSSPGRRKIWYVPTFREFDMSYDFFESNGFKPEELNEFLKANNAELILKLHHVDAGKFSKYTEQLGPLSNIYVANPDNLYEELVDADIMITDYSSVYFDFLLLNRPIIFSAFDYKKYKKIRNFYYDYASVTPGPRAENWNDVKVCLRQLFDGKDQWVDERKDVNDKFNTYQDSGSSRRVFQELQDALCSKK
jgi:CDP-glycerol glycerophosphotransferase (TagB/SpsB family)